MANPDIPFGFRLWGFVQPPVPYDRDATSSTPIFAGDLVTMDNDGNINAAANTDRLLGVCRDFATGSAAKTNLMVWDDPNQKFIAQDDGAGAITAVQTVLGLNANHLATAGNILLKTSKHEIDISTATTASAGLRLVAFVNADDNTVDGATINARWVVNINRHKYGVTELGL